MSKLTYVEIAGKTYPMSFSLGASKKLISGYGSISELQKALEQGSELEQLTMISKIVELLIAQGCAYKNFFECDIPAPQDAPIDSNGRWTPLSAEAIEAAVSVDDVGRLVDALSVCMTKGSQKSVEAVVDSKNASTTLEDPA